MQTYSDWVHHSDDDVPQRPNPADDCLSSAQARRYWRLTQTEFSSSAASCMQVYNVASC